MISPEILFLAIIILAFIAFLAFSYLQLAARRRSWSEIAYRANLAFEPGNLWGSGMKVQGIYRGRELALDTFSTYTGKRRKVYTRLALTIPNPTRLQLEIYRESLLGKLGKALGMKDIQVGDAEIDEHYIIRGQPETQVRRLFTGIGLRQRLLEAQSLHIKLTVNELSFQRPGIEMDETNLISFFDLLTDLADQIERLNY